MQIEIHPNPDILATHAARKAGDAIKQAILRRGSAVIVAATGNSQLGFLDKLTEIKEIDWERVVMFHLDEYIGLPETHHASFRHYLMQNIIEKTHPGYSYLIQGDAPNPRVECARLNQLIRQYSLDVAFTGIGENGHLAFNDPPADFESTDPFMVVNLDETCRGQQVEEGWFESLEAVPSTAISMSIRQIMKAETIICIVSGKRKAQAVHDCLTGKISPEHPASILRKHPQAFVYLDKESAVLIH